MSCGILNLPNHGIYGRRHFNFKTNLKQSKFSVKGGFDIDIDIDIEKKDSVKCLRPEILKYSKTKTEGDSARVRWLVAANISDKNNLLKFLWNVVEGCIKSPPATKSRCRCRCRCR